MSRLTSSLICVLSAIIATPVECLSLIYSTLSPSVTRMPASERSTALKLNSASEVGELTQCKRKRKCRDEDQHDRALKVHSCPSIRNGAYQNHLVGFDTAKTVEIPDSGKTYLVHVKITALCAACRNGARVRRDLWHHCDFLLEVRDRRFVLVGQRKLPHLKDSCL